MSVRLCPKCQHELKSYDHFFCSNCGETLPENVSDPNVPIKTLISYYTFEESKSPKPVKLFKHLSIGVKARENRKYISIALILILVGIVSERLYGIIMNDSEITFTPKTTIEVQPSSSVEVINTPLTLQKGPFLNNDFSKIVPSDISVYVEFNDLSFLDFVTADDLDIKEKSTGKAALFKTNKDLDNGWGALVELRQESIVEVAAALNKFTEKGLKAGIFERYLLVSSSENVYENMLRAKDSLILNLMRNPAYSQVKAKTIPEGKILFLKVSQDKDTALGEVMTYEFLGEGEALSTISKLLEQVLNSSYNELVIN